MGNNGIYSSLHDEEAVLGSLLLDNSALDEIGGYLQPNDFTSSLHSEIYCAIRDLLASGKGADAVSISERLATAERSSDDLYVQLCEIMRGFFTSKNIKLYAELIKKRSLAKQAIAAAQDVISIAHDKEINLLDFAQQRFSSIADNVTEGAVLVNDVLQEVLETIEERRTKGKITGLPTGFSGLNTITNGLQNGDLIIIAGRPSMGKTVLGVNLAEHAAMKEGRPVAVFSLEMSREQVVERCLASVAKIDAGRIRSGNLTDEDCQKISRILPDFKAAKFFIDDRASLSVSEIRAKCRRIKREHGLALIVVDYISLLSGDSDNNENETIRISNISRGLKLLAKDLNVPVIAISQLNRALEQRQNKRPTMADLRSSGAVEQDADLILFIYRDEVYNEDSLNKGIAEIIVSKNRNGITGTFNLSFNGRYCQFSDYTGVYHASTSRPEKWQGRPMAY